MGLHTIDKCIFTDLPATNYEKGEMRDAIEYSIKIDSTLFIIRLPSGAKTWEKDSDFFKLNKHVFKGLIINNIWFENQSQLITLDTLKELLGQRSYPITPKEKADQLFQYILSLQKEDGEVLNIELRPSTQSWAKLYFKSRNEMDYYVSYLDEKGLVKISGSYLNPVNGSQTISASVTIEGLNYGIALQEEGDKSNLCFVAMTFDEKTAIIRTAIKEALWETGFKEILIDEQNIDSDRTINDEIIANLKKCRFCIADFSYHSRGVYFESGFALGQGKKVIYTCLKDQFDESHFDIKPLQHIIYLTAEQLKKDLINKIDAWIK